MLPSPGHCLCTRWVLEVESPLFHSTAPFQHAELTSSSTTPGFEFGSSCPCFQRSHRLHYVEISRFEVLLAGWSILCGFSAKAHT